MKLNIYFLKYEFWSHISDNTKSSILGKRIWKNIYGNLNIVLRLLTLVALGHGLSALSSMAFIIFSTLEITIAKMSFFRNVQIWQKVHKCTIKTISAVCLQKNPKHCIWGVYLGSSIFSKRKLKSKLGKQTEFSIFFWKLVQ